jgi:hypothetical protein
MVNQAARQSRCSSSTGRSLPFGAPIGSYALYRVSGVPVSGAARIAVRGITRRSHNRAPHRALPLQPREQRSSPSWQHHQRCLTEPSRPRPRQTPAADRHSSTRVRHPAGPIGHLRRSSPWRPRQRSGAELLNTVRVRLARPQQSFNAPQVIAFTDGSHRAQPARCSWPWPIDRHRSATARKIGRSDRSIRCSISGPQERS